MTDTLKAAIVTAALSGLITGLYAAWGEINDIRRVQIANQSYLREFDTIKEDSADHETRIRGLEKGLTCLK